MQELNPEYLLAAAIDVAIEAGREVVEVYNSPQTDWQVEQKADHSPLTLADRRAHTVIAQGLHRYTDIPLLSEEGAQASYALRRDYKLLWVVDPLDGTKEFIKRNGEFTVNIALVEDGIPLLGVVYAPVLDTLYYGLSGTGAFKALSVADYRAGRVSRLPLPQGPREFTVVASRSHLSRETQAYIDQLQLEHGSLRMVSAGSSLKICLVAEGTADVYPRLAPTMEWDTAAGHAVIRAAGGTLMTADTAYALVYNKEDLHNPWFVVTAPPRLAD